MIMAVQPKYCFRFSKAKDAFTLVEIVLALGILAFVCATTISLIGLGMSTFRKAVDRSVVTQIAQLMANEARQSDFAGVTTNGIISYFDDQGQKLSVANTTPAIYVAQALVFSNTNASVANPYVKTIVIQVANKPGGVVSDLRTEPLEADPSLKLWSSSNPAPVTTSFVVIAQCRP